MTNSHTDLSKGRKEEIIDVRAILLRCMIRWPWFIASIMICLTCAWLYLRYTTPTYNISASIIIKDEKKGGNSDTSALESMGLISSAQNIDNEITLLQSKTLIKKVVKELKLYTTYRTQGRFNSLELYNTSPISVEMSSEDVEKLTSTITLEITLNPDRSLHVKRISRGKEIHANLKQLPTSWKTEVGNLTFAFSDESIPKSNSSNFIIATIVPPMQVAKAYKNALSIAPTSESTSIALLSLQNSSKQRGEDFINKLVEVYNRDANDDKNEVTEKTAEFIRERIEIINKELGNTEEEIENFKRDAGLTDLSSDAQMALTESSGYEKERVKNGTQINLVSYLAEAISKSSQEFSVLPSNVGLTDATLSGLIDRYNIQVIERNRLLRNSSETNPVIVNLDNSLRSMKANIQTTLASVQKGLLIAQSDIERQAGKYKERISNAPNQERRFISISRQQEIKAGLYLMLLQKREENAIALAATANNAKIVDEALANDAPISPKRKQIFLVAFVIGMLIPAGVIYLFSLLQFKIESPDDVEKLTSVPIVGNVPLADAKNPNGSIVVQENSNNLMAETFRGVRTSLQFMLEKDKKVILVTSTISGEGKTFIATNLAISFALLGKKVVVVGLDIRKPGLNKVFNLSHRENGITQYLANPTNNDLMTFVQPSRIVTNLSVLAGGAIPPNPTELLAREALVQAIDILKANFDYVIIDTAPIGMVTDTLIIGRVADVSLYVCRADYTHKNDYRLIEELNMDKKLPQLCTVINGMDMTKRKYGYYGYAKYGKYYGNRKKYGYGE